MNLNPKTTAYIFPGQGSQAVGMGKELAETYPTAKELFDEADASPNLRSETESRRSVM